MKFFQKLTSTLIEKSFFSNYYEDISKFLTRKKNTMRIYKSEIKNFLFQEVLKVLTH